MAINALTGNVDDSKHFHKAAGRVDYFLPTPTHVDVVALSTSNATYTLPAGARWLVFSPIGGANFAVRKDAVAVFPAAGVTNGTGSFLNPSQLDVQGVTSLGIISNESSFLSIAVYG
jgi:hypothetical protein